MNEIIYTIGGVKYDHRELTWGQDKELIAMITKISVNVDGNETIAFNAKKLKSLVLKYDILGDFWGLVLIPQKSWQYWAAQGAKLLKPWRWRPGFWRWIDLSPVTNSDLEGMFEDFFLLNKKLMKRLSTLNNVLGLISQTAMAMAEEPKKSSFSTPPKPPPSAPKSAGN
jgi:hypothetical protein